MLSLKDICVKYSYKTVLIGVSLDFEKGKIYSLLGENGAGKSTLARVLCGDLKPTGGSIYLNEKKLNIKNPKNAIDSGIVCVHQRPLLASSISVKDNLRIGIKKEMVKQIPNFAKKWIPGLELSEPVKNLNEEECFYTSLTGALLKKPGVLILDEPPFLDKAKIRELADSGITIIIITHNFKEAIEKSDQVVLLKDGKVLEVTPACRLTEELIREKLFGLTKTIPTPDFIEEESITEEEVLEMRRKIFGSPFDRLRNRPKMAERTIGYIPSDRTFRASNPNLTIFQLCTAYHTKQKQKELEDYAKKLLNKADVNIKLYEKANCLSGGMLQRLILERELAQKPDVLYLFDPTHGLDLEATERLYSRLSELAAEGRKIIIGRAE